MQTLLQPSSCRLQVLLLLLEVRLRLLGQNRATLFRLDETLRVTASQPLMADLKALLGPSCLAS